MPKKPRINAGKIRKAKSKRLTSKKPKKGAKATKVPVVATRWSKPSPRSGMRLPLGTHSKFTGGKKGRSGRKPEAFKRLCRELVGSEAVFLAAQDIATNPNHPGWNGAVRWLSENGYGKPAQLVRNVNRNENPTRLTKEEVRTELERLFSDEDNNENAQQAGEEALEMDT